jgi:hypothetical protein
VKTIGVLLPGLLLAGLCGAQLALAQDVPPGTYLRSCGNVYLQGGTLIAACQRTDGSAQPTALPAVQYCIGDIGNMNGALACEYGRAPAAPPYFGLDNPPRPDG